MIGMGDSNLGYSAMGHVTSAHREGKRLRDEQNAFEKRAAEELGMEPEEIGYYFQRMRQDSIEGAQYNFLKTMLLQAKLIWGEDYSQKKLDQKRFSERRIEMLKQEQERIERARWALLTWDIQCDEIFNRLKEEQSEEFTCKNEYERYVFNKLMDNKILFQKGFFRRKWKANCKYDKGDGYKWPIPEWIYNDLDQGYHISRRKI